MAQRFHRHLQQEAILRVHLLRFAHGDAEHFGVEKVDVPEETALLCHQLAGRPGVGVVQLVRIPAVDRHARDRVHALRQELPVRVRVLPPGKAAGQPDQCHWQRLPALLHLSPSLSPR